MTPQFEQLSNSLNLSPYQSSVLYQGASKYNVSRLVKRGPVLYAPYMPRGIFDYAVQLFLGPRADLIGKNKTLLHAQRRIKFYAAGLHRVKIGRFMYYADSDGAAISREAFQKALDLNQAR